MTYKVEVIADDSGKWSGNSLRFNTRNEAHDYAIDLMMRWTCVRIWRVVSEQVVCVPVLASGETKQA